MDGVPALEFAAARGGRVAYQTFGSGDVDVVAVPPAAQNIEVGWDRPEIRSMLERFGSFCRLTLFDKRGTGSSDRPSFVPGLDERVDDMRAVMDAARVDRAHLFAQSEGGPMALMFAATYPHRVHSVILLDSCACLVPGWLSDEDLAEQRSRRRHFASVWGTPDSLAVDLFAPSRASDAEFRTWHQRYERLSASSDAVEELFLQMLQMDARAVVPELSVPLLVLHRRDDRSMPIELGREVAELAPDARLVELDGEDHFGYLGDVEAWMREVEHHVTGEIAEPRDVPRASSPGSTVEIATLGRFAVTVDGEDVATGEWGSRRARTLLKRLVVARGWPVPREELMDMLWPDEADLSKLGARLSVVLSNVRRVLGGGVAADRQTVALDLGAVTTDLERLLDATDDATVVNTYTGEFLPEDRFEEWTEHTRSLARRRFVDAARRRLTRATAGDRVGDAIGLAHRLAELDPFDDVAAAVLADLDDTT